MESYILPDYILIALLWGIVFYLIQQGLGIETENIRKRRINAILGSIAVLLALIIYRFIKQYLKM